jgi:PilZ domain
MDAERPDVNDLVDITLDQVVEALATVVMSGSGNAFVLEAPVDRGGRFVLPTEEMPGLMVWRGSKFLLQVPVVVTDVTRPPRPSWRVEVRGTPARCQRRAFVRSQVDLKVTLRSPEGAWEVTGADLGEGGMRCVCVTHPELSSGDIVTAEFDAGAKLVLEAKVVRLRSPGPGEPLDLGLQFTSVQIGQGDAIRSYVFAELQRRRRLGVV